jgi:hypothetical protein
MNAPTEISIESLQARLSDAEAWAQQTESELQAALLAQVDGTADAGTVAKARKAAEQARQGANDAALVLAGAQSRNVATGAAAAAAETARRWQRVEVLAAERAEIGAQITQRISDLGGSVRQLIVLSREIATTAPGKIDHDAAGLGDWLLLTLIREALQQHEVIAGAGCLPFSKWELERRPSLNQRIAAGNENLMSNHERK